MHNIRNDCGGGGGVVYQWPVTADTDRGRHQCTAITHLHTSLARYCPQNIKYLINTTALNIIEAVVILK